MKEKKLPKLMLNWLCLLLFLLASGWSNYSYGQATLQTDKEDYQPGETVIISGTGWQPGETINMVLEHLHFYHENDLLTGTADENGNFEHDDYIIDPSDLGELFMLVATGEASGYVVITYFTDGPAVSGDGTMNMLPRFVCGGGSDLTYTAGFTGESGNSWAAGSYLTMNIPWVVSESNVAVTNLQRVIIGTLTFNPSGASTIITIPFTSDGNNPIFNVVISGVNMPVEAFYEIEVMTNYGGTSLQPIDLNPEIASSAVFSGHVIGGISSCSSVTSGSLHYYGTCETAVSKWQYRPLVNLTTNPITWGEWVDIQNSSAQLNLNQSFFNASGVDILQFRALVTAASCCGEPIGTSGSNNVYESDYAMIAEVTNPIIQAQNITSYTSSSPAFGLGVNVNVFSIVPVNSVAYYINYGTPEQQEITSGYDFGFGTTTTVTVVAANFCAVSTETFTVSTGLPPAIACPEAITQDTDQGVCDAVVTFALAYVADPGQTLVAGQYNGLPEPVIFYSFDNTNWTTGTGSGLTYPKGETTVYLKAVNAAGEANCSFTVTVEDNEAPVLIDEAEDCATLDETNLNQCLSEAAAFVPNTLEESVAALYLDNCPGDITATYTSTIVPVEPETLNSNCAWTFTYEFTIADVEGNETTCSVTYSGSDQDPATLDDEELLPGATNVNACMDIDEIEGLFAKDDDELALEAAYVDDCGTVTATFVSESFTTESTQCGWTLERIYTISDGCVSNNFNVTVTYTGSDQDSATLDDEELLPGATNVNACMDIDEIEGLFAKDDDELALEAAYIDDCGTVTATFVSESFTTESTQCGWTLERIYTISDGCESNDFNVTVTYTGSDQTLPTVITQNITVSLGESGTVTILDNAVDDGSYDNCTESADLIFELSQTEFSCDDIGINEVTLKVTDLCGNFATGTATVTITVPTVTEVFTSAEAARYMDEVTLYAIIDSYCGTESLTGTVDFYLDDELVGENIPAYPVPFGEDDYGKLRASLLYKIGYNAEGTDLNINIMPKDEPEDNPWIVKAEFTPTTEYYVESEDETNLIIYPRDASPFSATVGFYTGPIYAWTTTPASSTGTVTLSATIVDTNVPVGDVRGATITFYYINSNGGRTPIPSAQNLPVGLVDQLDGTVGAVSADVQLNLGNQLSADYMVGIEIKGGYTNDPESPESQSLITIYKQTAGGRINGSAKLVNTENTNGQIKGAIGETTEVSFDVTYNKKGRNPQGRATIIVWSWYDANGLLDNVLHKYIITSNAINATIVNQPETGDGYFSSKANLKEEIDGQTISIQGNSVLQMWLYDDNNDGGSNGLLGIQYDKQEGGIWYSNNWNGYSTEMEQIAGTPDYAEGIVQVSADYSKDVEVTETPDDLEAGNVGLFSVYPNPTSDKATFRFVPQADGRARLELYSTNGAFIQSLYEGEVKTDQVYELEYRPADRVASMVFYRLILNEKVINGKLLIQR
ncbi:MAG: HYR domain-containing protein [Lentimicrobium sp.]|nr:HYR domain-containing protein [Lentimicrobium sp.]